ncbi:MAG TPA: lipopolysaccharide biosynthesis protein [Petrimonas sp.]|uniref:Wzz/FepE/Etk N-terminal domain-containing protein n=1 Tax=Petrimonas sp. TaxID=2023866 RepID=UPI0017512918|nr:lipopolysaccharide biosynthesis protein [Petrimonas sp.]
MEQNRYIAEHKNAVLPPEMTDEIDLTDVFRQLWVKRRFILKVTGIFLLLGIFIAFFSPVKYTTNCTVVSQTGKSGSNSNLGGLAALMGVNIGAIGIGETLSPSVYPQIVKSVPFTREIMQTPIMIERSEGKEIRLYDYYTNKQYQPFNLIGNIKKYTIGLPGVLIGSTRGNDKQVQVLSSDTVSLPTLSKEEERVYQIIQSSMQLTLNPKEGYITISYSFPEAEAAARITDQVRKTLEKYVTRFKSEKAEDNLAFVAQSFKDAQTDFLDKQNKLASFQDTNRGLTTASARATEQRLRSEYDVAFTVYNELAKQLEQAKLAVKETKPVLTVIEPVVVPVQKSAPRRSLILIGFLFLGLIVATGWVLVKPFVMEISRGIRQSQD